MGDEFRSTPEVTLYQKTLQRKCLISISRQKFPFVKLGLACLLLLPVLGPHRKLAVDRKKALLQA